MDKLVKFPCSVNAQSHRSIENASQNSSSQNDLPVPGMMSLMFNFCCLYSFYGYLELIEVAYILVCS
jgi:hypothetical protein